jgi:photosystem II stability/assembly factor-like uncharacterized protein
MRRMFTVIYTTLLTIFPITGYAQLSFNDVAFWPTEENLGAAVSVDNSTIIIGGSNRVILKSSDSGNTWQKFDTGPVEPGIPCQLFAPDPMNIIMCYDLYGYPDPGLSWFKSSNGGETWNVLEFPAELKVLDMHIFNTEHWVAVGADSLLMQTFDGGNNWDILLYSENSGYTIQEIFFLDETYGWYTIKINRNRLVFSTTNGGLHWQQKSQGDYYDPQFVDPLIGFAHGGNDIYKTTDGGNTWFSIFLNLLAGYKYKAIDSENIYVSYGFPSNPNGPGPHIIYSTNGGDTWEPTNYASGSFIIFDIIEFNNKILFVGTGGFIAVSVEPNIFKSLTGDMMTGIFAFEDEAIAVGYGGQLFRIKDEGNIWEKIEVDLNGGPNQITFINDSVGFIIGSSFLRTTDGGNTWHHINFPYIHRMPLKVDINNNIYVNSGSLFRSSNFGETWTEIPFPFNTPYLYVYDSLHLWASTNIFTNSNYHRTTNGGITWDTISANAVVGCEFFSPDSGYGFYASGSQLALSRTNDGGLSWNPEIQSYIYPSYIYQTEHHPDYTYLLERGFYVGFDESIYPFDFSEWKDGSYTVLKSFLAKESAAFSFYDRTNGWMAAGRKVFRIREESVTSSGSAAENIPHQFELFNNYPNPFNPVTKIIYKIPETGKIKLSIFDILGNEIAVLVNEEKGAGEYQVEWNASGFSSGVYFYRLTAGEFSSAKKLLLMK